MPRQLIQKTCKFCGKPFTTSVDKKHVLCAVCTESRNALKYYIKLGRDILVQITGEGGQVYKTVMYAKYDSANIRIGTVVGYVSTMTGLFFIGRVTQTKDYGASVRPIDRIGEKSIYDTHNVPYSSICCIFKFHHE